ncbi:MAG: RtcB family protein [Spirochaetales bacterium]|nr:RtcB family protein [Spirochaetales bacterium]
MKWVKKLENTLLPIKSWCQDLEEGALEQAINLANHPAVFKHVALMPDCHQGYGMPIGGVIGCLNVLIPNAVGVDIGCGMGAIKTNLNVDQIKGKEQIRGLLELIKKDVPLGEGNSHKSFQKWKGFDTYLESIGQNKDSLNDDNKSLPKWLDKHGWELAQANLGTLGGGNHFIELQKSEEGRLWLMLHSGSRNLGYRIANSYHSMAKNLNAKWQSKIPDSNLAFLPVDTQEGEAYLRDMNFAMEYARENRSRMMKVFKRAVQIIWPKAEFEEEINIHHNYASLENHFGRNLWVHRKGATSARENELGIIPGSMGTSSYIVRGLGNPESFSSCSHGAGRKMSRTAACENLSLDQCNRAMEGVVFDRFGKLKSRGKKQRHKNLYDLSEAPLAYKDIDAVIEAESDLIEALVKLSPLGVLKG